MYSRVSAILGAPTSAAALALAEESAPIDDALKNVSLLLIESDYLQSLHIQEFSYIYENSSLDNVRPYEPADNLYYDEHQLYLRFDARVSSLNTLNNILRVGVAQGMKRREALYTKLESAESVRAVYICSGPTVYIYLMEAILIALCELKKGNFFGNKQCAFSVKNQLRSNAYEFVPLVSAPRSIIFATLGKLALFMRDVLERPVRFEFSLVALERFALLAAAFASNVHFRFASRSLHARSRKHSRVSQLFGRSRARARRAS